MANADGGRRGSPVVGRGERSGRLSSRRREQTAPQRLLRPAGLFVVAGLVEAEPAAVLARLAEIVWSSLAVSRGQYK
jgi:hypothetical protein